MTDVAFEPQLTAMPVGPNMNFSLMRRLAAEESGEFHETASHVVVYLPGRDRLVCGFDNLSWTGQEGDRLPLGL